jgi:hypothetical protein
LRLRNLDLDRSPITQIVKLWWTRLSTSTVPEIPVHALYCGDHWSTVLSLSELAENFEKQLWVASAGYGLVPIESRIRPYAATFSSSHPDSVHSFATDALSGTALSRAWWAEIAKRELPDSESARSIAELAREDDQVHLLVVAGPQYLAAMEDDLLAARATLTKTERLILVSSPLRTMSPTLAPNLIPSTARLQPEVGGALTSLHARVAARILQEAEPYPLDATTLQERYSNILLRLAKPERVTRVSVSDDTVRAFIQEHLLQDPRSSCTSLLRRFRADGKACEQSRFRQLYQQHTQKDGHA